MFFQTQLLRTLPGTKQSLEQANSDDHRSLKRVAENAVATGCQQFDFLKTAPQSEGNSKCKYEFWGKLRGHSALHSSASPPKDTTRTASQD